MEWAERDRPLRLPTIKERIIMDTNRQVTVNVKRYEANTGFIFAIAILCVSFLFACYMVTMVAYAALESGERLLGYQPSSYFIDEPALEIPTQPPTAESPALLPAPTITATGVITP